MDIRNILVSLEPGVAPTTLSTAVDLARRFRARIVGFSAAEPSAALLDEPAGIDRYRAMRSEIEEGLSLARADFDARAPRELVRSWISGIQNPTLGLRQEAIGADLLVVQAPSGDFDPSRHPDIGDLILTIGRPLLVLGSTGASLRCNRILVAWKDTREARRAVVDALPFLRAADEVLVATVDEGDYAKERGGLDRIVEWLHAHDIPVRQEVLPMGRSLSGTIHSAASAMDADLIVAGGYGHSRFREWLLGGMTKELLDSPGVGLLLSN